MPAAVADDDRAVGISAASRVGLAGAAVMGVAFGMVRYAYGLTLPDVRTELGLDDLALGLIGSASYLGFLFALVLAWITTGASGGLVLVGPLALAVSSAAALSSWRWTWGVIAALSAAAAVLNLRWVPRVASTRRPMSGVGVHPRTVVGPLVLAVVLFVGATAYLTYAADAARRGGLGTVAGPAVFLVAGAAGLVGSTTGGVTTRFGPGVAGGGALVAVGAALAALGLGSGSPAAVLASAVVLGVGNAVGSAVLAIWTAERVPAQPGAAFTVALVTGSVAAVATPAAIGALTPLAGLPGVLLAVAALCVLTGVGLARR